MKKESKGWEERFDKLWKQNGLLCEARHYETYNGGEVFEQCSLCRDDFKDFTRSLLEEQRKYYEEKYKKNTL